MENELSAIITADIKGFQASITQVEKDLARAEGLFKKSSIAVEGLERSIQDLANEYKKGSISEEQFTKETEQLNKALAVQKGQLSSSANEVKKLSTALKATNISRVASANNTLAKSAKNITGEVKGANTVALEFNRIIQDAPFGIMGVGNNLQQLTANFSSLSKNVGGSGKALKAAFSALVTGPNIALLAISALTTGLTVYSMWANKAEKSTEDLAEELDKYRSTLTAVNRAQLDGISSGEKEALTFKTLKIQAENANAPLENRIEAVDELQKLYPNYLGNLSKEQILAGDVGTAYENLTKQIIATAKAQAAKELIGEKFLDLLTLQQKQEETALKIQQEQEKLSERKLAREKQLEGIYQAQSNLIADDAQQSKINDLKEEEAEILKEINQIKEDDKALTDQIIKLTAEGAKFTKDNNLELASAKNKLSEIKNEFQSIQEILGQGALTVSDKDIENALDGVLDEGKVLNIPIKFELPPEESSESYKKITENMKLADEQARLMEESFNKLVTEGTLDILKNSMSELTDQILAGFSTGNTVIDNFIKNIIKQVPQVIAAFQKMQVARQAQAAASKAADVSEATSGGVVLGVNAAKALGPVGLALLPVFIAGALGIISSAFGKGGGGSTPSSVGSASYGNTQGREFGGPVQRGQAYVVGEKRPEIFIPNESGVIVPNIPSVSANGQGMGSGVMNIKVEVEGSISGENIRLSNRRATNKVKST